MISALFLTSKSNAQGKNKGKVASLCLTKYNAITNYPLLNLTPRHEDVLTQALDGD
jgi:hypothetical protein